MREWWAKVRVGEAWQFPRIDTILQDLRSGFRSIGRNPGFSLIVIVTLALGIGPNTAVFSVINAFLLRPLPYPEPERLVMVGSQQRGNQPPRVQCHRAPARLPPAP